MWTIRQEQMDAFEQAAWRQFEEEMIVHTKDFSPRLCKVIGDEQLLLAIRSAIRRAGKYGFTYRGPIRLFIEMMFLRGSAFDTDPQYPAVGEALRAHGDQMSRAQQVHEEHIDYLERVSGPDAENVRKALTELLALACIQLTISKANLVSDLIHEMKRVFPQRAAYTGEAGLKAIIDEGLSKARRYGFTTVRAQCLIVVLMFAFGHGCTNDPLYPWIARTLCDERIVSPAARAQRLEKKAMTWLEHVLARSEKDNEL